MAASKAVLLLVLHYFVKLFYCAEYYVKADSSSICPTNATSCFTLSEYIENSTMYFTSGSIFTLLQGQHHLNKKMALSNVTGIIIRRHVNIGTPTIIIAAGGIIVWNNSSACELNFIEIQYSGEKETRHAALVIEDSTSLQIQNVQFNGGTLMFSQGIRVVHSRATFVNCSFRNWYSCSNGGAVYAYASNIAFSNTSNFTNNKAYSSNGGGVYVLKSIVNFSGNSTFLENYSGHRGAGLYSNNSNIMFSGTCTFKSNYAKSIGGGIHIDYHSTLNIISKKSVSSEKGHAEINFINNTANQSGGALVVQGKSKFLCEGNINFVNNYAKNGSCGGVCILHSIMNCSGNITFKRNFATCSGGGMHVLAGTVNITGSCSFQENMAKNGGGMTLEEDGWKSPKVLLHSPVTMNFNSNRAISNGGGIILIKSNSQFKIQNRINCFFSIYTLALQNIQLNFIENSAGRAGSVLYGGYLNCPITVNNVTNSNLSEILNISNTTNETVSRFSSDAVKLCFCNVDLDTILDCNISNTRIIQASPGINFNISVVALGLGDVQVPSTIQAFTQNDYAPKKHPPMIIEGHCTNISYKIYTEDTTNKTLVLYPDATSSNYKSLVMFQCPPGFTITNSQCRCSENKLTHDEVIKCVDTETLQIERLGNSWIDIVNDSTNSSSLSFMYHTECPLNYCRTDIDPIPLNFTNYDSNILCSSNRTGKLCGACVVGYSLTLNRFNCKKCDNSYISLLLFFAFAGVAVIVILLVLHMTVAAGTINGLILYANIVNVNSYIFFPSHSFNKLSVFISWLNLDFGIETCFYNGLNAYAYALLEYVFPLYLWFLIGAIIISSRISAKVRKLFGSNPVAVLATVILMSYTKLFQAALVSLHYTSLKYSEERRPYIAWYYDANIPYFRNVQHISLAVTALCMICFLLLPYTFLLIFSYHLQALSRKRAFSWLNKIKPLLDAYYAPYRAKTRYWPGFMLLVRCCLYTFFLVTNRNDNLIAISCVFTAVALIPWLGHRVYVKFYNEVLEASFILNICLLSAASSHVLAVGGKQEIVTYLSISVAFLQFLGIVAFHLYLRLKNIKFFVLFKTCLMKKSVLQPKEVKEDKPTDVQKVSMTVMDLREPLLESLQ